MILDDLTVSVWNARTNEPVAGQLVCDVTKFVQSVHTADEVELSIPVEQEFFPAAWGHTVSIQNGAGDIVFHGPVTDVAWSETSPVVTARAESWRGYPVGLPHGREASYLEADPAVVTTQLWEEALSYPDSPQQVTFQPFTSPFAVGKAASGEDQADPLVLAWFAGTDLGQALQDLAGQFGFETWESHSWVDGAPRTVLSATATPTVAERDVVFQSGVNILSPIAYRQERAAVFSSVLSLGSGEGPSRWAGDARADRPILRRAHLDAAASSELTAAQLLDRASRKLAQQDDEVPFDSLTVDVSHAFAPSGMWACGDVVTVQSAGEARWKVRVVAVEWKPDGTAVISTIGV